MIGTLVGWILLSIAFGIVQWVQKERASIITRILMQRHVAGGSAFMFLEVLFILSASKPRTQC